MVTNEELTKMSDDELDAFLSSAGHGTLDRDLALEEIARRRKRLISRSLWSRTLGFWMGVLILVAIIALLVWR
jgi:hypothetical protein